MTVRRSFTVGPGSPISQSSGILYVVSTPIGNLEDVTLRALRVLRECDLIAAEDTRVTRKLLSHFDIHTRLTSYHKHSKLDKAEAILSRLAEGENVALVSDAGTPGISDPGAELIARAIEMGIAVIPIPGASAVLSGLVASGLPTGRFAFDGFPSRTKTDRREFFTSLASERRTIVLYEAPTRLLATLLELQKHLGDRRIAVAREVTKRFEEIFRGRISEAAEHFRANPPRGEFTLILEGSSDSAAPESAPPPDVGACLRTALGEGMSGRDAVQQVAEALRLPRKQVYAMMLNLAKATDKNP